MYAARATPWLPIGVAASVTTGVIVFARNAHSPAAPLQAVSIILATAAATAVDDPAAEVLGASPTTLRERRLLRVAQVVTPIVSLWAVLVVVQQPQSAAETATLVAMFGGLIGLALGTSALANARLTSNHASIVVGPTLLVLLLASTVFPPPQRPLPMGDIPGGWSTIQTRWTIAAVIGASVFLVSSRDRAARRLILKRASV
jgi:hypothetical protein